jgi:hypothetical protein
MNYRLRRLKDKFFNLDKYKKGLKDAKGYILQMICNDCGHEQKIHPQSSQSVKLIFYKSFKKHQCKK